jgi:hypothetical protein
LIRFTGLNIFQLGKIIRPKGENSGNEGKEIIGVITKNLLSCSMGLDTVSIKSTPQKSDSSMDSRPSFNSEN